MKERLIASLLVFAAFPGCFTVIPFVTDDFPFRSALDVVVWLGILAPGYLVMGLTIWWLLRRPAESTLLGYTRQVWFTLIALGYLAGVLLTWATGAWL